MSVKLTDDIKTRLPSFCHLVEVEMDAMNHLKRQLTRYKDLLANLSRKNRELYYKEVKGSSINLSKQQFAATDYPEKKKPTFEALRAFSDEFQAVVGGKKFDINDHFDTDLVKDPAAVSKFTNRLDKIRLVDDKHQREYGISGAWLLGPFLCWRSSSQAAKEDLIVSPLFKLAIDLEKTKQKHLVFEVEEDRLVFNPSLKLFLKQALGVEIAETESFENVDEAVTVLSEALKKVGREIKRADASIDSIPKIPARFKIIKDENGEVIERKPVTLEEDLSSRDLEIYNSVTGTEFLLIDVIYLDQLNASRAVLINDYDNILEGGVDHPILNELFNGVAPSQATAEDREKLRELDSYKERDNYFVVDIDSTQHRAIDAAKKSRAIVIQGPPGTGKSQTIVNLIADNLSKGKKVLFVSEKRAALDVVFNRMKQAEIESQAVLIHSSELNKTDLYCSFLELAQERPRAADEKLWATATNGLDRVKTGLIKYSEALQATHEGSQEPAADIIFLASEVEKNLFDPKVAAFFGSTEYAELIRVADWLDQVQALLAPIQPLASNPWVDRAKDVVVTTSLQHALSGVRNRLAEIVAEEKTISTRIAELSGQSLSGEELSAIQSVQTTAEVDDRYETLWISARRQLGEFIQGLIGSLEAIQSDLAACTGFHRSIRENAEEIDVARLEDYYTLPKGVLDWLTPSYWSHRKLRVSVCENWDGTNKQFVGFRKYREAFNGLRRLSPTFHSTFSCTVRDSDGTQRWVEEQLRTLRGLAGVCASAGRHAPKKINDAVSASRLDFNTAMKSVAELRSLSQRLQVLKEEAISSEQQMARYFTRFSVSSKATDALDRVEKLIQAMNDLAVWDKFDVSTARAAEEFRLPQLREFVVGSFGSVGAAWSRIALGSTLQAWHDELISNDHLRTFRREDHLKQVSDFRSAADEHKRQSRQAVRLAFAKRWTTSGDPSGVPLLRKESAKQRKVLSPREIMEKGALKTMLQLKPCWLMSPLSISQMLPLEMGLFDVIIFDEASQVRVEDAIPSIYRASTMIVVGDNKQMPPTNFFGGAASDDDEDEEEISPSVLDLAAQIYPSVLLEWHYRSRSESLIAFSNRAFYAGRLIAAPNPVDLAASGSLKFTQVPNAYFSMRDGNTVEADAVISKLIELLSANSKRSYGIIAMGVSQATALEEALEKRCANDASAKELVDRAINFTSGDSDAGLFIKNLENVQGDERDVILMSVGYAPAGPEKKMAMRFGPLSMKGGGRRLNVAITRAKSEMHVFSSFAPAEVKTDEETFNRNPDLCTFGRYLKYAEAISAGRTEAALGVLNSFGVAGTITNRKSSRFALDVKRRLEQNGFVVSAEIGSSGFFIDLAVHHPTIASNFVIGIECDGAIFHSTPYARDRDKIRQALLEDRGWKIERVWSQDWSRNWRSEVLRLEACIRQALEGVPATVSDTKLGRAQ